MNDGGDDTCDVVQVKLISLPLLIKSSGFPKIFALETEDGVGKKWRERRREERK